MNGVSEGLIIGTTVGVVIGVLLAVGILLCMRYRRSQAQIRSSSSRRSSTVPIRANGVNTCAELSNSTTGQESPREFEDRGPSLWIEGPGRKSLISASGIPKYAYKELQKATSNFTKLLGQGAFGPVYKADMSSGEILAVKVLANNSKQGEKEFQNEVLLLGRLHHRNLVNLVGYCAEKGQHILLYAYMPNGSLASHLHGENSAPLRWDLRVNIALDVARGLEYLHDGAVPPVVHRDIKSPNILLDQSMHARVADFGLSREEMLTRNGANIRGTYGYLDPEYVSSRSFTKKSDVYSYGVLLFELIAGRNPQQGLMEYVELAAINGDGKTGWEEIADSRLEGAFDVEELNDMAAAAYKCVSRVSRKRPSMRDVVQALIRVAKHSHNSRNRFARLGKNVISVYETETFSLIDKKSLKVENVVDFSWSPTDPIISLFVPELGGGNQPARVSLVQIPGKEEIRQKNLFSVSDCKMYWQNNGEYLAVQVDRYTKTKKSIYTGFELFRIKERDIPIEVFELENKNDKIIAFAWEPKGHRFAVIHGDGPKPDISFYTMKAVNNNVSRVSKLTTLKGKQANALFWSPAGRFIVLAGLKGFNGQLEFFNVDDLETMATGEHFMATDIMWDPTGRFLATAVTSVHEMENGFQIWSFNGKLIYKISKDHFYQFQWRPRPPSLLTPEKEEDISKNLKRYSKKYEQEDLDVSNQVGEQERKRRTQLQEEWQAWVAKWKQLHEEERAYRMELRGGEESDKEEEAEYKEIEAEELVDVTEEIVAFDLDQE